MSKITLLYKLILAQILWAGIIIFSLFNSLQQSVVILLIIACLVIQIILIYVFLKPLYNLLKLTSSFNQNTVLPLISLPGNGEFTNITTTINNLISTVSAKHLQQNQFKNNLQFEQERFQSIFNALQDGVIALDFENKILTMNSQASKMTGFQLNEVLNQPFDLLVQVKDREGQVVNSEHLCTQNPTSLASQSILTITGKPSNIASVSITCSHIRSASPTNLKCLLILKDASLEKSLQGLQIDFVSMASHELRTPITSILGYMNVFLDENKKTLSKEQTEFLNRVLVSAQQLATLVDNLLNVSKVERNAFSINSQTVDWSKLLSKVVEDNRLLAAHKNIVLSLQLDANNALKVLADPIRTTEVVNNLLSNAVNFTPVGGSITVGARQQGSEVITSVKDTGIGIPHEAIAHLFTKFFRVSQALDQSSNSKGTGLGLYLSKSIIELHHGRIWVESEVGKGSTFSFTLPISQLNLPSNLTLPTRS